MRGGHARGAGLCRWVINQEPAQPCQHCSACVRVCVTTSSISNARQQKNHSAQRTIQGRQFEPRVPILESLLYKEAAGRAGGAPSSTTALKPPVPSGASKGATMDRCASSPLDVSYGQDGPAQLHSASSSVLLKQVERRSTVVGPYSAQKPPSASKSASHITSYLQNAMTSSEEQPSA